MLKLGVNIDHIATVRQARKAAAPRPLEGALLAEKAGAWGITAHLREDRRHIQDADIRELAAHVKNLNMEMAVTGEMVRIACEVRPHSSCRIVITRVKASIGKPPICSCKRHESSFHRT